MRDVRAGIQSWSAYRNVWYRRGARNSCTAHRQRRHRRASPSAAVICCRAPTPGQGSFQPRQLDRCSRFKAALVGTPSASSQAHRRRGTWLFVLRRFARRGEPQAAAALFVQSSLHRLPSGSAGRPTRLRGSVRRRRCWVLRRKVMPYSLTGLPAVARWCGDKPDGLSPCRPP